MTVAMAPNDRWSVDFVSDQLTDDPRFRILTVVDDCTHECLALAADTSLSGTRVARELDRLVMERGRPKMVVSDNGSEFTSNAILTWADQSRMALHRKRSFAAVLLAVDVYGRVASRRGYYWSDNALTATSSAFRSTALGSNRSEPRDGFVPAPDVRGR